MAKTYVLGNARAEDAAEAAATLLPLIHGKLDGANDGLAVQRCS